MILTPTADNLPRAIAALNAFLDATDCGPKARFALEAVLEEVFMNIVHHSGATVAELDFEARDGEILLRFADDGIPYNPLLREAPDLTLSAEERSIGGLGVLMVKRMTDRQTYAYSEARNRLTLAKRIS